MTSLSKRCQSLIYQVGRRYKTNNCEINSNHMKIDHSCKILVLGGGAGGCSLAAKFANQFGKGFVSIVEPSDKHYYQPLLTLVGAGVKELPRCERPMASVLPKDAFWVQDEVATIDPRRNIVTTKTGYNLYYDYLVVALGLELHFDRIKGLQEALCVADSGVSSNYSPKYAERTFDNLKSLKEGNAVFTFPNTPIKCAGAPLKACYLSEHYIRNARRRNKVKFFYRTSLPVIFSVKHYAKELMCLCDQRDIDVQYKQELIEVDHNSRQAFFRNVDKPNEITNIRYSMLHAVPPMSAPRLMAKSCPDLVDHAGYLRVNKATLKHDIFDNIYGLGDCTNLPTSKTAAAVAAQSAVVYHNLLNDIKGKEEVPERYDGYTACPLVTGYGSCIMAEFDYELQPLETFPLIDQSKEHLSMYLMKKEFMPFLYWHAMLNGYWNGPKTLRKIMHLGRSK